MLYTKQFYVLFVTDMCVSFYTFLTLIISLSQFSSPALFPDGKSRYLLLSAILSGSIIIQPTVGLLFDSVNSIRVMGFGSILAMVVTAGGTVVCGV